MIRVHQNHIEMGSVGFLYNEGRSHHYVLMEEDARLRSGFTPSARQMRLQSGLGALNHLLRSEFGIFHGAGERGHEEIG
jgi:hypothetical protein